MYVITRDYGFAPNPFPPYCTLATCKPKIRKNAEVGDYVVGIGSGAKDSKLKNKIIYIMKICEKITFEEYWKDKRFQYKKPVMNGSKMQMYGDNIYHIDESTGKIIQENSHHSLEDGTVNMLNLEKDLSGKYVLISNKFWYWGGTGYDLPDIFKNHSEIGRGHISIIDGSLIQEFECWLSTLGVEGYIYAPWHFRNSFARYDGK